MCLLMVCLPGECPSEEYLANAAFNNSDGFGFAVHDGERIVTGRGMRPDTTISKFYDALAAAGDNAIGMFHARLTTHGKTNTENCHPFRVGGNKDIILGHNGILPLPATGDRSDTRIFAEDVLPAMGVGLLDDKGHFDALEEWMGGSKVVVLSASPLLRDPLYILNEHLGDWDGGIWWSNGSYKSRYSWGMPTSTRYPHSSGGLWSSSDLATIASGERIERSDDDDQYGWTGTELCYVCSNILKDEDYHDGLCSVCNTCLDCFDHATNCMCYRPSYADIQQRIENTHLWYNEVNA